MIKPVKGSDLAEQIERARQRIERWPQWLKDAAGVNRDEPQDSASAAGQQSFLSKGQWSTDENALRPSLRGE